MKNPIFRGMLTKNQYIGGKLPKKRGLGQFVDLRGGLDEKQGVVFLRGYDTPMHTMFMEEIEIWDF